MILNIRTLFTIAVTAVLIVMAASSQVGFGQTALLPTGEQTRDDKENKPKEKNLALEQADLKRADLDGLIGTLEDPQARDRLIDRLKTLKAAAVAEGQGGKPNRVGGQLVETLSNRIDRISEELVGGVTMVLDAPGIFDWAQRQILVSENRRIWVDVLWKVLSVIAAGLVVEWAVRRLFARTRRVIEGQERESIWMRLPFLLARTLTDIVPVAAFAGGAYLILPLLHPDEITRLVVISLINANVIARIIMASARMVFVPRSANLRVLNVSDETANYIVLWVRRLTNITIYGYFFAEIAFLLGLQQGGYLALTKIIGLLTGLLLIIFILQNRRVVAEWVSGPASTEFAGLGILRRRLGDIWHVIAVIYVGAVYVVWALEVSGGFDFVFRATAISILVLFVAKILVMGSQQAVNRGFGVRKEVIAQYPGLAQRANRYFTILHTVITGIIALIAIFLILEAWGADSFGWIGTDTGRRLLGSVVSSLFVIIAAVVFWEMVSSVIERYLARGEEGGVELSARAKTLLPLLRKVLLVTVSTVVGLIVLSEIGVNIGPLLAGAGVIGLAIGFGSQTLVKDVITGVFILAEDQFAVGDVVRVNDKAGLVEDITIRTIRLRDLGGNVHMIPFSSVEMVENMTKDFSRYILDVGIAYRENVDEVIDVLRALGSEMQEDEYYGSLIIQPIEIMGLDQFADSAVVIRARLTTKPIKQWEVGREFNRRMKQKFDELGIEIPFPHHTVYFGEDNPEDAPKAYIATSNARGATKEAPKPSTRPALTDNVDNVADDGE